MEILIRDNIVYESFENQKELKERIMEFIINARTDKILYKGSPLDINYKLLKKIVEEEEKLTPEQVRDTYQKIVDQTEDKHCLIFKK